MSQDPKLVPVRQLAATLAYRAAKVLRDVPPPFPQHAFGDATRRPVRIVPLLASFVHECLARGVAPGDDPPIGRMLGALRDTLAAVPRRYCLIAGADLAHVGPRFGDPERISAARLARIEAEDRALLSLVAAADPGGFFAAVRADGDSRRICGLSPIYALLATLRVEAAF